MEKSKKLRLKRKIPQHKSFVTTEVEQNQGEVETVTVSSDSECDVGPSCKQRKISDQQTEQCNDNGLRPVEKGFLQTDNPSLNKLRAMILSLSPRDVDITNLSPFPVINTEVQDNSISQNNCVSLVHGRLQPLAKLQSGEGLSPFPKPCKHFRKTSRKTKLSHSNEITIEKHTENMESEKLINEQDKHDRELMNLSEYENTDGKHKQNFKKSAHITNVKGDSQLNVQPSHRNEYREENSTIIKDRNSNYYALQSKNKQLIASIPSARSINRGEDKRHDTEDCDTRRNNPLTARLPHVSSTRGKSVKKDTVIVQENSKQSRQSSKGDEILSVESVESVTQQIKLTKNIPQSGTSKGGENVMLQNKLTKNIPRSSSSRGDESVLLQNKLKKKIPQSSSSKGGESVTLKNKLTKNIPQTGSSRGCENVTLQNKLTKNIPQSSSSRGGESVTLQNKQIRVPQAGSSIGGEDNKESVTLQSCPLCQMKFDSRIDQMELDSHIAACLSTSEDDVMW